MDDWNLFKNSVPNLVRLLKGIAGSTARALPGMMRSSGAYMTALKRSVVGSGPMRAPGKSRPIRYRMNEVLPTEY